MIVPNKDERSSLCVNYCLRDQKLIADRMFPPIMKEISEKLKECCYFTNIEFYIVYWPIPVSEKFKHMYKTNLLTRFFQVRSDVI